MSFANFIYTQCGSCARAKAKRSSTQRESRIGRLPVNLQGINAALQRRKEIMTSTLSIIKLRSEEAIHAQTKRMAEFQKPRNLSTIGFNNRRIKIGLGKIRSPFCHKIGMYGNVSETARAGLRRRPVSAPRERRESQFTRSNVFTQSCRRMASNQRPQSAAPALRYSLSGPSLNARNHAGSRLSDDKSPEVRKRPRSAAPQRGNFSSPGHKIRPQSAQGTHRVMMARRF